MPGDYDENRAGGEILLSISWNNPIKADRETKNRTKLSPDPSYDRAFIPSYIIGVQERSCYGIIWYRLTMLKITIKQLIESGLPS